MPSEGWTLLLQQVDTLHPSVAKRSLFSATPMRCSGASVHCPRPKHGACKRKASATASEKAAYDVETVELIHAHLSIRPDDRLASLQPEDAFFDILPVFPVGVAYVLSSLSHRSLFLREGESNRMAARREGAEKLTKNRKHLTQSIEFERSPPTPYVEVV